MFVEHSSPRADRILNTDISIRETSRLFSPKTLSPNYKKKQQSPKRKYSDDFDHMKRSRSDELKLKNDNEITSCHGNDWPVFIHPEGGYIQQSPYGFIHIIKDANSERSSIDNTINLETFSSKLPDLKHSNLQQSKPSKPSKPSTPLAYSNLPLPCSPSSEVESYMVEGYASSEHNKSYDHHKEDIININYNLYDYQNEDAHLAEDVEKNEDYDMML